MSYRNEWVLERHFSWYLLYPNDQVTLSIQLVHVWRCMDGCQQLWPRLQQYEKLLPQAVLWWLGSVYLLERSCHLYFFKRHWLFLLLGIWILSSGVPYCNLVREIILLMQQELTNACKQELWVSQARWLAGIGDTLAYCITTLHPEIRYLPSVSIWPARWSMDWGTSWCTAHLITARVAERLVPRKLGWGLNCRSYLTPNIEGVHSSAR